MMAGQYDSVRTFVLSDVNNQISIEFLVSVAMQRHDMPNIFMPDGEFMDTICHCDR